MLLASSISPERRLALRRLRAEFEAAVDAMGDEADPAGAAYQAADARYRAWVKAVDAVAILLLDDIDAFEAIGMSEPGAAGFEAVSSPAVSDPAEIDRLFSGLDDVQRAADLIGSAPAPAMVHRKATPRSRAMDVVGIDRAARQWSLSLGHERGISLADHFR